MIRASRLAVPLTVLLFLSASCATTSRPAAPRDAFPLDPREGLPGPFPSGVSSGWEALLAGQASRAREHFERARAEGGGMAARIGVIEALVEEASLPEALAACSAALAAPNPTAPLLVACGEAQGRSGKPLEAWELYRQALGEMPAHPGLEKRAGELRSLAGGQLRRQAQEAAGQKDWAAARRDIARSIVLDPASAASREASGDIELEAGNRPAALAQYREAYALDPDDPALWKKIAPLALEVADYAAAVPVLDKLAALDPGRYETQAAEARLAFRIANWPAAERAAARSSALTRGEAALLLWWMVPEVRDTKVTVAIIASDIVGRPDGRELTRVFSLGLLEVDRDTHRASPDSPLSFSAAARSYLRLLALLSAAAPPACLRGNPAGAISGPQAIQIARLCGILLESEAAPVSGAAFTRDVDRVRALAAAKTSDGPEEKGKTP